jgi:hypothetical protein
MQAGGDRNTPDEQCVQRARTVGDWAGVQAGRQSDTLDEKDVQRALTANDWTGMQAQRGDSGIQDEGNVLTALTTGYWQECK